MIHPAGLRGRDGITSEGEGRDMVEMLAELPDLWDLNVSNRESDSLTSRFGEEGFQEPCTAFIKALTGKPVVGVGWFTSPDTMAGQIRRGVLDMIGAARAGLRISMDAGSVYGRGAVGVFGPGGLGLGNHPAQEAVAQGLPAFVGFHVVQLDDHRLDRHRFHDH